MKKQKNAPQILPREEWPYEVPENWVWTQLGDLCNEIQYGYTAKAIKNDTFPKMLRITDIQDNRVNWNEVPNCEIADNELNKYELIDGDIVFARTGATTGKSYIITLPPKAVYASYLIRVRLLPLVNNNYTYNFLQTSYYWNYITEVSAGIAQPGCNAAKLAKLPIPLPPLPEQQRIIARIESLFARLDTAAEKIRAALDQFPIRKAAILHKAFTGELTKNWREENGVGMESWKNSSFGDITNIKSSKRIFKDEYVKSGIPFFRGSEIVELHDKGYTIPKYFISETRYNELAKNNEMPSTGDLLVTSVGTIGKTWIVDERRFYYKDGNITLIEKRDNFDMCYIQYYCESGIFNSTIHNTVAGSAYNALTIVKFKKIVLPIPSLPEQKEIVRILDAIFEREQAAKETAERLLEQIALTKKSILARAFRGLLGTNDPKEESAEGWLKEKNPPNET